MMDARRLGWVLCGAACCCLVLSGCVDRTMKIRTEPPGALVIVNDEEVGVSPVKVSFLWYGDYDIILRKDGYETLKTHWRIDAPWYEWPPIDLVAETMIPSQIHDDRESPTFALTPAATAPVADVVKRATELRDDAMAEPSTGK